MVLDYSGSMVNDILYLERSVDKFIKLANEKDRISFVKFDDKLDSLMPLTDDKKEMYSKFGFKGLTGMGGATALYAACDLGFRQFDSTNSRFKKLILFTDGYENASMPFYKNYAVSSNAVIAKARASNIPMYIISYGYGCNLDLLDEMAGMSGGKHYNICNPKSMEKVFNEFIRTSKYFYEITYKPNIADKERSIELIYNNNLKTATATSKLYIGDDYDMMPLELNFNAKNTNNFVSLSDSLKRISKLKPTASPQVITLFDFDKSEILPKYQNVINTYVKIMKEKPLCEAVLIGHTDRVGNDEYCYKLSSRRANEIKEAIVRQGIRSERIKILGFGKQQPVWNPEKNETQARENRRVEILILE
jgi:outer membrane protein OmpA-like peptidoglycan-associated protein